MESLAKPRKYARLWLEAIPVPWHHYWRGFDKDFSQNPLKPWSDFWPLFLVPRPLSRRIGATYGHSVNEI
jgi:hypothetical protein